MSIPACSETSVTDVKSEEYVYEQIKPRLHHRIGRELRLAYRVLDLGCGSCDLVRYLADTYDQNVTGVDISSDSFPKRRRNSGSGYVRCIQADVMSLNFAADYSRDAVVIMWALHEMWLPGGALAEAYRVLRPGGEILIVDFPRGSLAQKLWNEKYFSPKEVEKQLVRAGFDDIQVRLIMKKQILWARGFRPSSGCPDRLR